MVAAILSRPRAIATGISAAYLHGFHGFGPGRPSILVPWTASGRSTIAKVTRSVWFATLPRATIRSIETISAAETVVSLAAELPAWRIIRVFEDGLAASRFTLDEFDEIFERVDGGRVRGIRIVRKLAAVHSADAPEKGASYLERFLEMLLAEPVVPDSVREFPFQLRVKDARVDAYIPDWEIVVEADGRNEHTRREAFETDRERDNGLAARGILVMRFTYRKLRYERDQCLRNLVEAGRHRS
jgi:very-short-patch-repair endonuclease